MENKTERIMRSLFIRILGWIKKNIHLFNLQKWIHLKNNDSDHNWRILGLNMDGGRLG